MTAQRRLQFTQNRSAPRRQGAVLVVALVCLIVIVSLIGYMLQSTLRARRQLQSHHELRQVEFLLHGAAARAMHRLQTDTRYRGETWQPTVDHLAGTPQVDIRISRQSNSEPWRLQLTAEYPLGSPRSVRRSLSLQLPPDIHENQE